MEAAREKLVSRLKRGESEAFKELLEEYSPMVLSLIDRMIFDSTIREDLAQDIFMKVIQNLEDFREDSKLSTWIYSISYRHLIDHIRKIKRDPMEQAATLERTFKPPETENIDPPVSQENKLLRILDSIPEKYRIVITLRYLHDKPIKTISQITDLPEGTVKVRIHRGLKLLRKKCNLLGNLNEL